MTAVMTECAVYSSMRNRVDVVPGVHGVEGDGACGQKLSPNTHEAKFAAPHPGRMTNRVLLGDKIQSGERCSDRRSSRAT